MIKITIEIEGMKCPRCEAHTTDALTSAFNPKSVKASHKENKAEILTETDIPDEKLLEALAKTGYTVGDITREEVKESGFFARFKK